METATSQRFLLVSFTAAALLTFLCANGSPLPRSHRLPIRLNFSKLYVGTARELRIKYEHLVKKQQPWQNCSARLLRPSWRLSDLTGWDQLEAGENVVSLSVQVLQNRSEEVPDKIAVEVLNYLEYLEGPLQACINKKPSGHPRSENLQKFKEKFQKFNASNFEQSPKCLEAAVGLDIHRLLKTDVPNLSKTIKSHNLC